MESTQQPSAEGNNYQWSDPEIQHVANGITLGRGRIVPESFSKNTEAMQTLARSLQGNGGNNSDGSLKQQTDFSMSSGYSPKDDEGFNR